jgi:hypothetical protein
VEVGSADAGVEHADLYVVDAHLGLGYIFEPDAALCPALYQCLHSVDPSCAGGHRGPLDGKLLLYEAKAKAPCAGGDHLVVCLGVRVGLPLVGADFIGCAGGSPLFVPTNGRSEPKRVFRTKCRIV